MAGATEIFEFFIQGSNRQASHGLLHISEPDETTPNKGSFFAICEIVHGTPEQIRHMQSLIDDLESGYYETNDQEDQSAFEIALEYVNKRSGALSGAEIHCLVGVIYKQHIVFSGIGHAHAYLFYRDEGDISWTTVHEARDAVAEEQLFSSVTEGSLEPGDIMFFSTPAVSSTFSADRVSKLLRDRSSQETAQHIERSLQELRAEQSFTGMFVETKKGYHRSARPTESDGSKQTVVGSTGSINNLIDTQRATEKTLSPPVFSSIAGVFKQTSQSSAAAKKKRRATASRGSQGKRTENTALLFVTRSFIAGVTSLGLLLWALCIAVARFLRSLFLVTTNLGGGRAQVLDGWKRTYADKKRSVLALPLMSKIFFFLAIIFVVLFLGSILFVKVTSHRQAVQAAYNAELDAITSQVEEARASLIYDNAEKALPLLQRTKDSALAFAEQSKQAEEDIASVVADIDTMLLELRKIEYVDATELFSLATQFPDATAAQMAKIGSTIVLFDENTHYVYDIDTSNVSSHSHESVRRITHATVPNDEEGIILSTALAGVAVYEPNNATISQQTISFPTETDITDLFVYNDNLYTLSTADATIYKHTPVQTGYGRGSVWPKEETPALSNGRALAIDGSIYILTSTGVEKFTKGIPQEYALSNIDPVLSSPTDIWTYSDVSELYILDASAQRILVINKASGTLIKQIQSEQFQNPISFFVDINERRIYVLDNNRILTVSI